MMQSKTFEVALTEIQTKDRIPFYQAINYNNKVRSVKLTYNVTDDNIELTFTLPKKGIIKSDSEKILNESFEHFKDFVKTHIKLK